MRFRKAKQRTGLALALIIFLLSAAFAADQAGAPADTPALPPGVEVRISANPPKATVGDPIQLDIEVVHPGDVEVQVPSPGERAGDCTVLEFLPGPIPATGAPPSDGTLHHRARIIVALYRTGEFEFPSIPITLNLAGKRIETATSPVKIRIESILPENDATLKDLKKQAEIEAPFPWRTVAALGGLFLLLIAALALWLRRKRRSRISTKSPPEHRLNPLDLAEAELRDLLTRGLLEKGFIKPFYVDLSEIVKRVLEAGFGVSTVEKTTAEIMYALQSSPAGPAGSPRMERIESLLLECDLVKFARYVPSRQETDAVVVAAFAILQDCRHLKAAAVAGEAPVGGAP